MESKKFCLIADKKGKAWNFALEIIKEIEKESKDFELIELEIKKFSDGEIKPKILETIRKRECFFIHDSNEEPSQWLLELILVNQTLKNSSAKEIINVLPYLKFSRQDRKDEARVPISARVVADAIQMYADRVITLDVHNPAIEGFYKIPFENLQSFPTVINFLKEKYSDLLKNIIVMSTDAGGAARAKCFARNLGLNDLAVGYKTRNKDGKIEDLKILGEVAGKNVLIVDDIIDSGETLLRSCREARKNGAEKVIAYCTHGLFSKGFEKFNSEFDKLFIADSVVQESKEGIEIISFTKLFAQAILKITRGESISKLFE